jgi:hypothetical protein
MAENRWPLIPREELPAPVPAAAKAVRRPPVTPSEAGRQLSIFGAETTEPSPSDLAALLAGPGRLDRMGGTARVSVRVDAAWRVHVLVGELVCRGLVVTWRRLDQGQLAQEPDITLESDVTPEPGAAEPSKIGAEGGEQDAGPAGAGVALFEVRTAYSSRLKPLADAWPMAADQLFLSGPRLRLWVAAAGRAMAGGYALGLDPGYGPSTGAAAGAALRRAGLEAAVSDHGRDCLIMGGRRLARLAELVGERPAAAPEAFWPGSPAA